MENITLLIKTFERMKSLEKLVKSIDRYYKDIQIIVIDDSKSEIDVNILTDIHLNLEYYYIGYDLGLSAGRNIGISKIKTEYFILLDDDFYFTEKTNLEILYMTIDKNNFDMVGFDFYDFGYSKRNFRGTYKIEDKILTRDVNNIKETLYGYPMYDFILNCFIGRTSFFRINKWDDKIKIGFEHDDFFINIMKYNPKITHISDVAIEHYPEFDTEYLNNRHTREEVFFKYFKGKNKIDKIINNGQVRSIVDRIIFSLLYRINKYKGKFKK